MSRRCLRRPVMWATHRRCKRTRTSREWRTTPPDRRVRRTRVARPVGSVLTSFPRGVVRVPRGRRQDRGHAETARFGKRQRAGTPPLITDQGGNYGFCKSIRRGSALMNAPITTDVGGRRLSRYRQESDACRGPHCPPESPRDRWGPWNWKGERIQRRSECDCCTSSRRSRSC
jgi:hypothetical protein